MKIKTILPILLLLISFTSCVEKITRIETKEHMVTIDPQFSVEKETLKSRIAAIIPAEEISINSSKTTKSGEEDYHTLNVEILRETLPNSIAFYNLTDEIQTAVESGISNMNHYQKLNITVSQHSVENGIEHNRSYKKEIDL
ncbi:hypothetical protein ACXYMT_07965 [Salinimicrobium sp. CAU 1759]